MTEANSSAVSMVDVQTATQNAARFLQNLAPQIGAEIIDIRLEEVELSEDEKFWFITLGFLRPTDAAFAILQSQKQRDYKQFKVDAETGEVKAMKIRNV
ncbi:hypothetical protein GFS31_41900 (plasmid) [Leptolyngbya sp. BL0902]|uniref:hypothetical protein n=1 Tax=Leptolyngbya sp. BL0902 TaxID=1115757 RepID=UPI0018E7F542|nr:hypothetical protein [Leptolyngbya sp. BL0902]QQE67477.1 hypothetical protein GFS31_41900 [Leptolyngbya sp. BL0902]